MQKTHAKKTDDSPKYKIQDISYKQSLQMWNEKMFI